jgi:hypothetical protein
MPPGWMSSNRRPVMFLAAVLLPAAALAAAGCGAGPDLMPSAMHATTPAGSTGAAGSTGGASPAAGAAARSDAATPMAPLTGLPAGSTQAAGRAAVALALSGSHPQGLGSADLVYEEMSRPLRYLALFQSREAGAAGPVTATRPTDAQALSVLHPLTGYDGGTPSFIRVLDQSQVVDVSYARYPSLYRPGTQGLTVSTSQVRQAARDTAPPQPLTYRGTGAGAEESFASTGAWRASGLRVAAPGQPVQTWHLAGRSHQWRQVSGGPPVQVANIVVQRVPYKTVFLSRKYGLTTTSARVIGSGRALMLSAPGTAARGTWSKPGLRAVTVYLDASGRPVGFQPGPTWVILAPPGTRVSTAGGRS